MGISNAVRAALDHAGLKQKNLAEVYGVSKQSMNNKFKRDAWFGKDLARIAELTGAELAFVFHDGTKIRIQTDSQKDDQQEEEQ